MLYLITYDLNKPHKDYTSLYEAIENIGECLHPLNNIWFVKSNNSSKEIRDYIKKVLDGNDELLVVEIKTPTSGAWLNLSEEATKWIKDNL